MAMHRPVDVVPDILRARPMTSIGWSGCLARWPVYATAFRGRPPPTSQLLIVTLDGSIPTAPAAAFCAVAGIWVRSHTSQTPS